RGLAVEAGQRRLGEDYLGKQIMDEAGLAGVQAGQQAAGQTELLANAEGHRIEPARQLRCTYEIEATQLAGPLVAIAGEGQLDEQAQLLAQLAKLMGKVEDAPAPHRIPLLMHAWNHLVIQPSQQCFEF